MPERSKERRVALGQLNKDSRLRRLIIVVFWVALVLTALSFGGAVHGLGDSLAVFRHWWAGAMSISSLLLLRGHLRLASLGVAAVVLAISPMVMGALKRGDISASPYALYQKNLLYNGSDPQGIIDDMIQVSADFVTMQEVSRANTRIFDALSEKYPSSLLCPFTGVGGVAVLSRWPLIEGTKTCAGNLGAAAVQVSTPDGPLWVVALHLHWPFPHSQPEQVQQLAKALTMLSGPVVLGGDFNMVPWSNTMKTIENLTGSKRAGRVVRTYFNDTYPLRLPIDHILVPSGVGQIETRAKLGSDHLGLVLRFDLNAQQ